MIDKNPYASAWMTDTEAAAYLSITGVKLDGLVKLGKVSRFRIAGKDCYTKSNLNKYKFGSNNK